MENDYTASSRVAIIGMAGKFPKAEDITSFWDNLVNGREGIHFFTTEELLEAGVDPTLVTDSHYVPASGKLEGIEAFDAPFFQYTPREAEIMDPQQRVFLELAWSAVEDAGYRTSRYEGTVGVFGGIGANQYMAHLWSRPDLLRMLDPRQIEVGNDKDFLATRVSYKLNLTGPSLTIQTACSSSLVSVHLACQHLLNGECDMALAGGVSIRFLDKQGYMYKEGGIESPDGHCRCFDEDAQGTVFGDGAGVVVLKRLDEAIEDGDHIYAVISGSAVNNDGSGKIGFTAPGIDGQIQVISEAMEIAGITPQEIGYVEAHGTGTRLGDKVEVTALKEVFRERDRANTCYLGSVKSGIGHLNTASGIAGLIKTALILQNKIIPPVLHFQRPDPQLGLEDSPFVINAHPVTWEDGDCRRTAGVSSFGIGGTNAHVIMEEAPVSPSDQNEGDSRWQLLPVSGKSARACRQHAEKLLLFLGEHPQVSLADVAFTLQTGREEFDYRAYLVCPDSRQRTNILADAGYQSFIQREDSASSYGDKPLIFWFPELDESAIGWARQLYVEEPFIRDTVEGDIRRLESQTGSMIANIRWILAGNQGGELHQNSSMRILLFLMEHAVAKLWMKWGIRPSVLMGEGFGQQVCARLGGNVAVEEAVRQILRDTPQDGESRSRERSNPFVLNAAQEWEHAEDHTCLDYSLFMGLTMGPGSSSHRYNASVLSYLSQLHYPWPESRLGESIYSGLLDTLGQLWLEGCTIDWQSLHSDRQPRRISLPTYAFEKEIHWIRQPSASATKVDKNRGPGSDQTHCWLIPSGDSAAPLIAQLEQLQQNYRIVHPGDDISQLVGLHAPASAQGINAVAIEREAQHTEGTLSGKTEASTACTSMEATDIYPASNPAKVEDQSETPAARLCILLEELLGVAPVGPDDDFFKLGGDSVVAIQLAARAREYGIAMEHDLIFAHPTIARVVHHLEGVQDVGGQVSPETVVRQAAEIDYMLIKDEDRLMLSGMLDPQQVESVYPLSYMQMLVLNHNLMNSKTGTANVVSLLFQEEMDYLRFKAAWQQVVDRHSILRTGFMWRKISHPVQFVHIRIEVDMELLDWSGLPEYKSQAAYEEMIAEERKRSFKTNEVPQMRFYLVRLGEACYRFIWSFQNSLFDGWSMNNIFQEVWELYYRKDELQSVDVAKPPFADYIRWIHEQAPDDAQTFWKQELSGFSLDWQQTGSGDSGSVSHQAQAATPYKAGAQSTIIPASELSRINDFGREHQLTLNTLLVGAWALTQAFRYNRNDLLVGIISSGRVPELNHMERMVGLFTNNLPVRVTCELDAPVTSWLQRLQKKLVGIRRYEHITLQQISLWTGVPMEQLQAVIQTKALVYTNFPHQFDLSSNQQDQGIRLERTGQLPVPFRVYVSPGEQLQLRVEYDCHKYEQKDIEGILYNFREVLGDFIYEDTLEKIWTAMTSRSKEP